jgi:hypothetical protein
MCRKANDPSPVPAADDETFFFRSKALFVCASDFFVASRLAGDDEAKREKYELWRSVMKRNVVFVFNCKRNRELCAI